MNVISANKENNVGIVTDPDKLICIGEFTPRLLKEWWKMVAQVYGDDQDVILFIRKADVLNAYTIFASSNGENPYVAVCGKFKDDNSEWENKQ